jgi:LysR family hydrogen peroxide-inducible transcriptional activator
MAASRASTMEAEGSAIEMQQIRYFLALCEERSFTRAARRCGISQPSLTDAIIRLEQELGSALFEGNRRLRSPCSATPSIRTSSALRRTQILRATRRRFW